MFLLFYVSNRDSLKLYMNLKNFVFPTAFLVYLKKNLREEKKNFDYMYVLLSLAEIYVL